ncbi:MAG: class I SAM-dependent methyltransferase [Pseudomonadales bacterium]|nr:class I SAM-dependent methyltransferase [Pseudomonadales bacterium]
MNKPHDLTFRSSAVPAGARSFLDLLNHAHHGHMTLVSPGGSRTVFGDAREEPGAQLHIADWRACSRVLAHGDIGFAEAYREGWLDSPDLTAVLRFALQNEDAMKQAVWGQRWGQLIFMLIDRMRSNTRRGSRRNIHAHYDIGNEFYRLWLDDGWSYSSAWFDGQYSITLEQAQEKKYRRVFDQLGLEPGMRVLEIGCGWGGFADYAAQRGVQVHGITLSTEQLNLAKQRIQSELVELELSDYRDVKGQYHAVVSIEMFEAVGESFWSKYFKVVHDRLLPGGKALIQSITIEASRFTLYRRSSDFIRQFIFPGGMLPSVPRFVESAAEQHLQVINSLEFGKDYAETLRRWRQRFEAALPAVRALGFDESFIKTWRLYLAYCEAGFDEQRTDVVQFLLQRA